ncbi:putative nucleotidyltransferase with HDIG domain [Hoeflea marina]|uniref:Putative nucleotidyltransferase with HDIG domain n=1 Tax=Hoeflea marina TaxID=274592 RepID=A0A317PCI0_9HYPH|nr:HD-GYP domain-containing protein [Hoeflea marina]PWV95369.1 putative nucleotidyltransferase with HDIG domain [Hoeflea marina]
MLTRIPKTAIEKGMFVEAVECSEALFGKRRFVLKSDADLRAIRQCPADFVVINTAAGSARAAGSPMAAGSRAGADPHAAGSMDRARAAVIMSDSVRALRQGLTGIATGGELDMKLLAPIIAEMADADPATTSLFFEVSRLKSKDETTFQHSLAVSVLMGKLGDALGLDRDTVELLVLSGMLHDVGKLSISNGILQKQGKLTVAERATIQSHPRRGHQILQKHADLPPEALEICLHHHEYLDGSGYPARLSGAEIGPLVRIATVCDVFEALTSARPYKRGWKTADALAWMFDRDQQFDRKLVLRLGACIDG